MSLGYEGPYGTYTISPTAVFTRSNPQTVGRRMNLVYMLEGVRTTTVQFDILSDDGYTAIPDAIFNVLTTTDRNIVEIRFKDQATADLFKGRALLRTPTVRWITVDAWPTSLTAAQITAP